jgi:transcriptional regulator with XRE-family HTH domain
MTVQEIIRNLREKHGLSQDQLAERVMVTRQAVSRWETGETQPNTETLKLLSKEFDVSINTLLGSPRKLICQCCGMPLSEDGNISKETDGSFNEEYCKWCYANGVYTYSNMEDLIDVCAGQMVDHGSPEEQARAYLKKLLPTLNYWKRYEELSDSGQFEEFKRKLIGEINNLHIEGMPKVEKLNPLVGRQVNLRYRLPSGMRVKFLNDQVTYLGSQMESEFGGKRRFGILADMEFILICTYEKDGENPELVLFKQR